jgi:hypothetical protein
MPNTRDDRQGGLKRVQKRDVTQPVPPPPRSKPKPTPAPRRAPAPTARALPQPPTLARAGSDTSKPLPRRYKPAYKGEKAAGYEPLPQWGKFGQPLGRQSRPYYQTPVDNRSPLERAADAAIDPLAAQAYKVATPKLTVPLTVAGTALAEASGAPLALHVARQVKKGQYGLAAANAASVLPFFRAPRAVLEAARAARGGADAIEALRVARASMKDAGPIVKALSGEKALAHPARAELDTMMKQAGFTPRQRKAELLAGDAMARHVAEQAGVQPSEGWGLLYQHEHSFHEPAPTHVAPGEPGAPADLTALHQAAYKGTDLSVFRKHNIGDFLDSLPTYLQRGAPYRKWYENSGKEILNFANGDKELASRVAQVVAIYSASRNPRENINLALEALRQWQRTGKIKRVATTVQDEKAMKVMRGEDWGGRKTNRFYANMLKWIDPAKYEKEFPGGEVTNDIWMARLFGLKSDVPTPREYDQMTKIQQNVADHLGWSPEEIQAALWVPAKADAGRTVTGPGGAKIRAPLTDSEAGIDFARALREESVTTPIEAAPGNRAAPETKAAYDALPTEQQLAYTREKGAAVSDFLNEAQVFGRLESEGIGVFEGETNPNFTLTIPMPVGRLTVEGKKTPVSWSTPTAKAYMANLISTIGDALNQDAMAWFRPIFRRDPPTKQNGIWLQLSRPLTEDETIAFGDKLGERLGGYIGTPPASGHDLYVLNYSDAKNTAFHDAVDEVLKDVTAAGEDLHADHVTFRFDGDYRARSKYTSGQLHKHPAAGEGGRSDVREAARRLRERSGEIDQRYLGGGDAAPVGGAAPEAAAVAPVPGLDVAHPGDVFPAHWADAGTGPGLSAVYDDARGWLADVAWSNMEPDELHALPDHTVARAIDKYYDGGMEQFISDSLYVDPLVPVAEEAAKPIPQAYQLERPIYDNGSTLADQHQTQYAQEWQKQLLDEFGNPDPSARFASGATAARSHVDIAVHDPYAARELTAGGLTAQFLKPRSRISRYGVKWIDKASKELDDSELVHRLPGVRNVTSSRRVVKAAGRNQRARQEQTLARMAGAIRQLTKLNEGSAEDTAHFWYAQLPAEHRNADGLQAVADMQRQHLTELLDGTITNRLDAEEADLKEQAKAAETQGEVMELYDQIGKITRYRQDIPFQVKDVSASIGVLEKVIEAAPAVNEDVINAMRTLAEDRRRILIAGGRLEEKRAAGREALLADELGMQPDGSEVYVGHRLAEPDLQGTYTPSSGGTGRVRSPRGAGVRNELVLAKNGRLRATTRVNYEDWNATRVFDEANVSRDDLGELGPRWTGGNIPADSLLVNRKGLTVPKHWRTDELAQFTDDSVNREEIRKQADDILSGFIADTPAKQKEMVAELNRLSIEAGEPVGDLRVVKRALVDRYYKQFRSPGARTGGGKTYDYMIDAVSTSIIFARVGYIPKNFLQNLIMAVPHQGAFLPQNAVRAGQVLNDPELRDLIRGETSSSGATAGLSREFVAKKAHRVITHTVTSLADDPARISAWLHEAANEGIIPRYGFHLSSEHRQALIDFLRNDRFRKQRFDVTRRAVEAMGDFTRMTPTQARYARRFLIIPGWLVAGSRYPFHFAATHPVRSALIAYALLGEPGAPKELQLNQPFTHYLHGDKYMIGFDTRWGRFRIASLNPISTPEELGLDLWGSIRGKKSPFDYSTPTLFDVANPLAKVGINVVQGGTHLASYAGVEKSVIKPLVPDYSFAKDLALGGSSPHYPDDNTWWRRLERETGVLPIRVDDNPPQKTSTKRTRRHSGALTPPGFGSGAGQAPGLGGGAYSAPGLSGGGAP